ncbi:MAG: restriction endonuclease [Burkholderiaceae bacterium]
MSFARSPGPFQGLLARLPVLPWRRRAAAARAADVLADLSQREFERLLAEGFRRRVYHVTESGNNPGLMLRRERETSLVDCDQWRLGKVGVEAVRDLLDAMAARGASAGFIATSGRFSREAIRVAGVTRVQLIDAAALRALIQVARTPLPAAPDTVPHVQAPAPVARAVPPVPSCPLCNKPMRLRIAKRGAHCGRGFWACVGHPDCKGLRAIT